MEKELEDKIPFSDDKIIGLKFIKPLVVVRYFDEIVHYYKSYTTIIFTFYFISHTSRDTIWFIETKKVI